MPTAKTFDRHRENEPDRKIVRARDLSEAEIAALRAAKVETDSPYELDDLDDDGQLIGKDRR